MSHDTLPVAIVGAGPIGLQCAINLRALGTPVLLYDAGSLADSIRRYPLGTQFFSSADRIAAAGRAFLLTDQNQPTREHYLNHLRALATDHKLNLRSYERVQRLQRLDSGAWLIDSHNHHQQFQEQARAVIVAFGNMHSPRRLDIPGEDSPHVFHAVTEAHEFWGRRLLVVGGRNSAVESALRCHRAGAQVAISYRRADFNNGSVKAWLKLRLEELIRRGLIQFIPESTLTEITATQAHLQTPQGPIQHDCDNVLLQIGFDLDLSLLEDAGARVLRRGQFCAPDFDPESLETSQPGLYVAGTAAAGNQRHITLFIENCHSHVARIIKGLIGQSAPALGPLAVELDDESQRRLRAVLEFFKDH